MIFDKLYNNVIQENFDEIPTYTSKLAYHENVINVLFDVIGEDMETDQENIARKEQALEDIQNHNFEPANPAKFRQSLSKSKRKEMLTDYSTSELNKMELYKVPNMDMGFALKNIENSPHKEFVALHNNSGILGFGNALVDAAIDLGAVYLDHFDTSHLSDFYEKTGFEEIKRDKYNPIYDEGGALKKAYGEVDVVYRKLKGK